MMMIGALLAELEQHNTTRPAVALARLCGAHRI